MKWILLLFVLFAMAIIALTHIYIKGKQRANKHNRSARHYGINARLPDIHGGIGIDVSRYQRNINWNMVRTMNIKGDQLTFAIIKATEGDQLVDVNYNYNFSEAKRVGLLRGAYHYFQPNILVSQQLKHITQNIELQAGDLALVLDIEEQYENKNQFEVDVLWLLQKLEQHYGKSPIIYASAHFHRTHLAFLPKKYPFWVAHYHARKPAAVEPWSIWQLSDNGRIDGISTAVDINVLNENINVSELLIQ